MKNIVIIAVFFLSLCIAPAIHARMLPRFRPSAKTNVTVVNKLVVKAKLRSDRKALIVNFYNLNKVNGVFYSFTYQTNGIEQGVNGSLDSSQGDSLIRELLFGTCSSGVCRYHGGLSNMRLEVTSDLPSGKRVVKRFRVKI